MLNYVFQIVVMPLLLLLAMAASMHYGVRLRQRQPVVDKDAEGLGVVDAAIFGLMGLLMAFSFSSAAGRFDARRQLVVKEANDVATVSLRIGLLPVADQAPLREKLREYVDSRLETYKNVLDDEKLWGGIERSQVLQNELWEMAVTAAQKHPTTPVAMLLLPSINAMFDTMTDRTGAGMIHGPGAVFFLLMVVMVLCSMLAGYRMGTEGQWNHLHRFAFVVVLALTYFVIIDLEFPRAGLINLSDIDAIMVKVRQSL